MKWLAILIVAFFTGCGTVRNFSPVWNDEHPTACNAAIYGGVRTDVAEIKTAVGEIGKFPHPDARVLANSSTIVCNSVDTPLSLVGDTVTLHRTIPATINRAVMSHYFPERENKFRQSVVLAGGESEEEITSPPEPLPSASPPSPALDHHHWAR
jgi:uncharacterized protein YceK